MLYDIGSDYFCCKFLTSDWCTTSCAKNGSWKSRKKLVMRGLRPKKNQFSNESNAINIKAFI